MLHVLCCQVHAAVIESCIDMSTRLGLNPDYAPPNTPAGTHSTLALTTDTACTPGCGKCMQLP
jgi:hypothetical protein